MTAAEVIKQGDMNTAAAMIRAKLLCSDEWLIRALYAVYSKQTAQEQRAGTTVDHNGVGFTGFDAELLTSFAEQVKAGRTLTGKQMDILRKRMLKYAGQLARMAKSAELNI